MDELVIAGCSQSVARLVAQLLCGERKDADASPVLYTGLNVTQHLQTRSITIDQAHYIEKLKEVPTRKLSEGLLNQMRQIQVSVRGSLVEGS